MDYNNHYRCECSIPTNCSKKMHKELPSIPHSGVHLGLPREPYLLYVHGILHKAEDLIKIALDKESKLKVNATTNG